VIRAINSLDPEHRGVIIEICQHGRSVAEAAAVLGVPAETVKSRAYYALKALILALQEQAQEPRGGSVSCPGGSCWDAVDERVMPAPEEGICGTEEWPST
jgi:hypothetical protein